MAEEHRRGDREPSERGNGGPVTPGVTAPSGGAHRATNGASDKSTGGTVAKPDSGGTVIAPEPTRPSTVPVNRTRVSGLWVGLTLSAVVLLFLLIFILQNNVPTEIRFLGAEGTLPVGVALLFAAALGILLVAIPGCLRILQLRRAARKRDLQ